MDDRVSIPGRGKDGIFFLRRHIQTGSGAHPASHPMGTGDSSLGRIILEWNLSK